MKGQIFRIAHLGFFDYMDTIALIGALEQVVVKSMPQLGVQFGDGLIAAQKVYAGRRTRRPKRAPASAGGLIPPARFSAPNPAPPTRPPSAAKERTRGPPTTAVGCSPCRRSSPHRPGGSWGGCGLDTPRDGDGVVPAFASATR